MVVLLELYGFYLTSSYDILSSISLVVMDQKHNDIIMCERVYKRIVTTYYQSHAGD